MLDDASTTLFLLAPNQDETPPYISNDHPFRTGASGTFFNDVIFSEGASGYRFEPLEQVVGPDNFASPFTPEFTRSTDPTPRASRPRAPRSSRSRPSTC